MSILGFDIGGANLKAATADGRTRSVSFPLWKHPEQLTARLSELVTEFADCESVAVTMTGELADCFTTRAEGVRAIAKAVGLAVGRRPARFWTTATGFVGEQELLANPLPAAAANWHAQATWIAQQLPPVESALLIDIGTTTTDIIPLNNGQPAASGLSDRDRLAARELIYTGVRRTPLCAVANQISWEEGELPVAAELFATTLDVYLLRGDMAEAPRDCDTANGRPATIAAAYDRIARMVCSDRDEITFSQAVHMARTWGQAQEHQIATAIRVVIGRQPSRPTTIVVSGSGEFLARRVIGNMTELAPYRVLSLGEALAPEIASAACAYAVTQLALRR